MNGTLEFRDPHLHGAPNRPYEGFQKCVHQVTCLYKIWRSKNGLKTVSLNSDLRFITVALVAGGTGVTVSILGPLQRRTSVENVFHLGLVGYILCGSQSILV